MGEEEKVEKQSQKKQNKNKNYRGPAPTIEPSHTTGAAARQRCRSVCACVYVGFSGCGVVWMRPLHTQKKQKKQQQQQKPLRGERAARRWYIDLCMSVRVCVYGRCNSEREREQGAGRRGAGLARQAGRRLAASDAVERSWYWSELGEVRPGTISNAQHTKHHNQQHTHTHRHTNFIFVVVVCKLAVWSEFRFRGWGFHDSSHQNASLKHWCCLYGWHWKQSFAGVRNFVLKKVESEGKSVPTVRGRSCVRASVRGDERGVQLGLDRQLCAHNVGFHRWRNSFWILMNVIMSHAATP